jgi:beta-galactosidase
MLEPADGKYDFEWMDVLLDRMDRIGIKAILATPSAAHPPWLSRKHQEVLRENKDGRREYHKVRQNFCRTSPVFREKTLQMNTKLAERYKNHSALLMWHISNEYGSTPCYCSTCLADFRRWLEDRYGDLEGVNKAWWTTFWSHQYTQWHEIMPVDPSNNGLMLDWQRYNSDQVLEFFLHEAGPLREITPNVPITTNFMKPDVGLDYWKIAKYVDLVTWDSYPEWHVHNDVETAVETSFYHDLHRGYKQGQPFYLLESSPAQTNWQPVSRLKRPGLLILASAQALAHGAMGVNYFQWRQSRGGEEKFHGAVMLNREGETSRTFKDVRSVGEMLDSLPELSAARKTAEVGIIYDFENEWAINLAFLPRKSFKEYQGVCIKYYRRFWQRGISTDILNVHEDFSPYKIVIAPMLYLLSEETALHLADFVKSGGTLITTYLTGWVNESDLCHLNGYPEPLDDVLGIKMVEFDTFGAGQKATITAAAGNSTGIAGTATVNRYAELLQPVTAETLAYYASEFYRGQAALTKNKYGNGKAFHIGADLDEKFLVQMLDLICKNAGVEPVVPDDLPHGVTVQARQSSEEKYIFVMNFNDYGVAFHLADGEWVSHDNALPERPDMIPGYGIRVYSKKR